MTHTGRAFPDGGSQHTRAHTNAYRIPAGAGQILATSNDYATVLARLSSLVVQSGFADECIVETCSHAEPDDPRPCVPAFDAWVCSVMHAPLVARGAVIGAVAFYRFESSTPFSEEDREIAEMLAWCAALVLDTAQIPASRFDGVAVDPVARSGLHPRLSNRAV